VTCIENPASSDTVYSNGRKEEGMSKKKLATIIVACAIQMTQRYVQSLNANDATRADKRFSPLDNMRIQLE